jgi:protein O-GlcNAc transferase
LIFAKQIIRELIQVIKSKDLASIESLLEKSIEDGLIQLDKIIDLGVFTAENNFYTEAEVIFKKLKTLGLKEFKIHYNLGLIYFHQKKYLCAIDEFNLAIEINPFDTDALINQSSVFNELSQFEDALKFLDRASAISSNIPEAWLNISFAYSGLNELTKAIDALNKAINIRPNFVQAFYNKGVILQKLYQLKQSIDCYEKVLSIKPDYAEAWLNKGNIFFELKKFESAEYCYEKVLSIKPDYAEAWLNKGNIFFELKKFESAEYCYKNAIKINKTIQWGKGSLIFNRMQICDWGGMDQIIEEIILSIKIDEKVAAPLTLFALVDDSAIQMRNAKICSTQYSSNKSNHFFSTKPSSPKIAVGYFSPDFYNHAVSILTAELYELHDRNHFEVIAFSYGDCPKDSMRIRLELAFDRFYEVRDLSDQQIANLAREHNIEIAVDLAGHTYGARPGIFAYRAAPIQISYLGFPGTQGAPYIDYILADSFLIPPNQREFYSEKIIYLPFYMINDSKRQIRDITFTRAEMLLPDEGFVYCCFNSNYKLNPTIFDAWLTILNVVDKSVLWLLKENELVELNLRERAKSYGINPNRLIFAGRVPNQDYLARYKTADLFLDTYPFNAGTTSSDALWVDLPVLTMTGSAFASRMAGSQLNQLGLEDLIATSISDYVFKAVELGKDPDLIKKYKQLLNANKQKSLVFDSIAITKYIEDGYQQTVDKFRSNITPEDIWVIPKK